MKIKNKGGLKMYGIEVFAFMVGGVIGYAITVTFLQIDLTGKFKNWNYKECLNFIKSEMKEKKTQEEK